MLKRAHHVFMQLLPSSSVCTFSSNSFISQDTDQEGGKKDLILTPGIFSTCSLFKVRDQEKGSVVDLQRMIWNRDTRPQVWKYSLLFQMAYQWQILFSQFSVLFMSFCLCGTRLFLWWRMGCSGAGHHRLQGVYFGQPKAALHISSRKQLQKQSRRFPRIPHYPWMHLHKMTDYAIQATTFVLLTKKKQQADCNS